MMPPSPGRMKLRASAPQGDPEPRISMTQVRAMGRSLLGSPMENEPLYTHPPHTGPQLTRRALVAEPGDHSVEPRFITFLMFLSIDSPLNMSSPPGLVSPLAAPRWPFGYIHTRLCQFLLRPPLLSSLLPLLPRIPVSEALRILKS